jgi:hypothetical protein
MPESESAEQPPQEPVELQRDTAEGDGTAPAGLSGAQQRTLLRLLKVAYPHPDFPDDPYERTAKAVQDADGAAELLADGLDDLDEQAGGDFAGLADADATKIVEQVADGAFFKLVHSTTVVALYDDHQVWELLGYEGPSFDKGGYVGRGFDDLDWLPDPRVEEYDGEPRAEIVTTGLVNAEGSN